MMTKMIVEPEARPWSAACVAASAAAPKLTDEMEARSAGDTLTEKLMLKLRGA
jgi:hypothetical protein